MKVTDIAPSKIEKEYNQLSSFSFNKRHMFIQLFIT